MLDNWHKCYAVKIDSINKSEIQIVIREIEFFFFFAIVFKLLIDSNNVPKSRDDQYWSLWKVYYLTITNPFEVWCSHAIDKKTVVKDSGDIVIDVNTLARETSIW